MPDITPEGNLGVRAQRGAQGFKYKLDGKVGVWVGHGFSGRDPRFVFCRKKLCRGQGAWLSE